MKFSLWFLFLLFLLPSLLLGQTDNKVLSLEECIDIALNNNSQLKIAKGQLEIAKKEHSASYSNIMPSVDVSGSGSRFKQAPSSYAGGTFIGDAAIPESDGENYNASLDVNQTIYDGGFWWNNISKTDKDKKAQKFAYQSEIQNAIVTVQTSYFNLLKAFKLFEVYRQAVERSEQQLNRTEAMYDLGSVAKVDVFQNRVNLGNDRINFLNQKNVVKQAKLDLNVAMGRDPLEKLEIETEIEIKQELEDLETLMDQALKNNPQHMQQIQTYQSSKLQTKLARSSYFPRFTAFFSYSRRVPKFNLIYEELENEFTWFAGVSIRWNLFNGFADKYSVEQAKIRESNSQEQLIEFRRNLKASVKSLYDNLKALQEIVEINKTNLESAREEYRLAQERYRVGSGTALELRDAQVRLTNAEQILVAAEFDSYMAHAELKQAAGELVDAY